MLFIYFLLVTPYSLCVLVYLTPCFVSSHLSSLLALSSHMKPLRNSVCFCFSFFCSIPTRDQLKFSIWSLLNTGMQSSALSSIYCFCSLWSHAKTVLPLFLNSGVPLWCYLANRMWVEVMFATSQQKLSIVSTCFLVFLSAMAAF